MFALTVSPRRKSAKAFPEVLGLLGSLVKAPVKLKSARWISQNLGETPPHVLIVHAHLDRMGAVNEGHVIQNLNYVLQLDQGVERRVADQSQPPNLMPGKPLLSGDTLTLGMPSWSA